MHHFTLPGLDADTGRQTAECLQERLVALADLNIVLKHVHWNVVGPAFIGVHLMVDEQVKGVRKMVDALAERIAALGESPNALAGNIVSTRSWDEYSIGRGSVMQHLGGLDLVYQGVLSSHREAIDTLETLDPVSQDLIIDQTAELEGYHWFVRAHLETPDGQLSTDGARSEHAAAQQAEDSVRETAYSNA